jgi:hypothetical protein
MYSKKPTTGPIFTKIPVHYGIVNSSIRNQKSIDDAKLPALAQGEKLHFNSNDVQKQHLTARKID